MKNILLMSTALLLAGTALNAVNAEENKETENGNSRIKVTITRVSDGDTVNAVMNGEKVRIRLANIDCPEIRTNDKSLEQAEEMNVEPKNVKEFGKNAQKTLKKLLDFNENDIYFEETPEYVCKGETRLVGYLYAGDVNVNEYMLKEDTKCRPFSCEEK